MLWTKKAILSLVFLSMICGSAWANSCILWNKLESLSATSEVGPDFVAVGTPVVVPGKFGDALYSEDPAELYASP